MYYVLFVIMKYSHVTAILSKKVHVRWLLFRKTSVRGRTSNNVREPIYRYAHAHILISLQAMSCQPTALPTHPLLKLIGGRNDCKQTTARDEQRSSSAEEGSDVDLALGRLNLRDQPQEEDEEDVADAILSPPPRQSVIDYYTGTGDDEEKGREDCEIQLLRSF